MNRPGQAGQGARAASTAAAGACAVVLAMVGFGAAAGADAALPADTATATATATPTPTPTPTDVGASPLLPNLRSLKAKNIRVYRVGDERRIRFDSSLANVGRGPLEVLPGKRKDCPKGQRAVYQVTYQDANGDGRYQRNDEKRKVRRRAGCMQYHASHHHWHVDASARYWLSLPGSFEPIVKHSKVSFCLRDSRRLSGFTRNATYGFCNAINRQGITPGWADVYEWFLPGQALTLPAKLPKGLYCLWQQADPKDELRESVETDNVSVRPIRIRKTTVTYVDTTRCG